jgi:5-methylthioadenosine/S-adenosylhomocysteine deaminase
MNLPEAQASLLITGRYVYLQDRDKTIIENGGVAVQGDTIIETGPAETLREKYPGASLIFEKHGLVMPGLVNTHTHAAMACFRGLADDLPLMQWLQEHIFPVEAKLNRKMVYQSTVLSIAEMIKSGTTSFCDMYLFAKDVARAAADAGMRAWIGEVLHDFPSPCYGKLESGFTYIDELFSMYADHPLLNITVDPHAVYTCSPDLLKKLKNIAEKHDALYAIHLSETDDEVKSSLENFGSTPVNLLENLGLLDSKVIANHCVILDQQEIDLLARRGVKVAHCPESNMKLASGVAPVPEMLGAGIAVGLGTDGSASNNNVDMFGEMNSAAKLHKAHRLDPTMITAAETLEMATIDGARVLDADNEIGSLVAGKKADLIVLDLNQPHLTPLYNIPSHLVYAARGADVVHSVINGKVVMQDRELKTIDEKTILANMAVMGDKITKMRG